MVKADLHAADSQADFQIKMNFICGILLTSLISCCLTENQFTFSFNQTATGPSIVCEGSSVTLRCVIVRNPGNIVQSTVWSRNGMSVTTTNSSGTFPLPNHKVLFNNVTGGYTDLLITNVMLRDNKIVYSCSASGFANSSSLLLNVTNLPPPPLPLNNITNGDICNTTVSGVSWTPSRDSVCGPISYDMTISPSDGVMIISINDTYYDITGLTPATTYNITIISSNMAGAVQSMMTVNTPSSNEALPSGVTNLRSTIDNPDTITVRWDAANSSYCGRVLYYIVMISSDEHSSVMNNVTMFTARFSNLTSDITYSIAVTAFNRAGAGVTIIRNISILSPSPMPIKSSTSSSSSSSSTSTILIVIIAIVMVIFPCCMGISYCVMKSRDYNKGKKSHVKEYLLLICSCGVGLLMLKVYENIFNKRHGYSISRHEEEDKDVRESDNQDTHQNKEKLLSSNEGPCNEKADRTQKDGSTCEQSTSGNQGDELDHNDHDKEKLLSSSERLCNTKAYANANDDEK